MADKPAKKFRIGYVTVTVWKNEGTERPFFTTDVQRTYKDGDEWKNTTALNSADLLNASHLLSLANAWVMEQ